MYKSKLFLLLSVLGFMWNAAFVFAQSCGNCENQECPMSCFGGSGGDYFTLTTSANSSTPVKSSICGDCSNSDLPPGCIRRCGHPLPAGIPKDCIVTCEPLTSNREKCAVKCKKLA